MRLRWFLLLLLGWTLAWMPPGRAADSVRLASYNVENYILVTTASRRAKPEDSRNQVALVLKEVHPDILALQEIGGPPALEDLRSRLHRAGLDFPESELVQGWDTNIQVALLSRYPIVARRPHTRETYLASGRRLHVSRGILEADIRVGPDYLLTLFVVHLKSRRTSVTADEAEMRLEEARILREQVDRRLREDPQANIVVLGDLNDTRDSAPVRAVVGRGRHRLIDVRPAERNGDTSSSTEPRYVPRTITWTHYYGKEDSYSRIDYVLLDANAERERVRDGAFIPAVPNWGRASDHRPVVVTLEARDR